MAALAGTESQIQQFEEHLDRAADEIFSTMLGVHCLPAELEGPPEREMISAVIGLAGAMSGSLVLHSGVGTAMKIAGKLTGIQPESMDFLVCDAIGELCNMLAGAWKGFDRALSSGCLLSTPTVVAGTSYELFSQRAPIRIERSYRFEDRTFTVTIYCEFGS